MTINKGDVIGDRYEVQNLLGRGGFGEVYLVYDRAVQAPFAMKTIRTEFLNDSTSKDAFKKEASTWVHLETHPCILSALWVQEFSGRLFVEMLYMAPDSKGRVSLADHLVTSKGPLDRVQTLKWALEFCHGMEHAHRHGVTCHRDIKPTNILITRRKTVRISDFGLAIAAEMALKGRIGNFSTQAADGSFGLSRVQSAHNGKEVCGTPGYIAPEVVLGRGADVRSDIYSFGLVLWQMATGSRVPPFHVPIRGGVDEYLSEVFELQMSGRMPNVGGEIQPIIERCLAPEPERRYGDFKQLRGEIEFLLRTRWGIVGGPPTPQDHERAGFWNNKGFALDQLGQYEEALACFSKAVEIDPECSDAWVVKGGTLDKLGRHNEAVACYAKAVEFNPQDTDAWLRYGDALLRLERWPEATACYSKALEIDPQNSKAWFTKGILLRNMGHRHDAVTCFAQSVEITPNNAQAWMEKATLEAQYGDSRSAALSLRKFLELARNDTAWIDEIKQIEALLARLEAAL